MDTIYITGHKNPDTDSIVSAMAYAALKNALGLREYKAARLGEISGETRTVLGRFHGELLKLSPGNCVVIYPEAHIWPCYTGVRPFRDSSFRYPVETGQPVFAFTVTYRRHLILPLPRTVVYIDGPFFPDSALTLRQNQRKLRDEVYNAMCRRSQKSNFRYHEYVEQTEEA